MGCPPRRHRHAALRVGSHLGSLDADNHRHSHHERQRIVTKAARSSAYASAVAFASWPPAFSISALRGTRSSEDSEMVIHALGAFEKPIDSLAAWRELSSIFFVTGFSSVGCGLFSVADDGASRRSSSSSGLASFRWSPCSGCRSGSGAEAPDQPVGPSDFSNAEKTSTA